MAEEMTAERVQEQLMRAPYHQWLGLKVIALTDDGIEIINFGPGSGAQGHAANESVPIAEMVEAAEIQLEVVGRLLGTAR